MGSVEDLLRSSCNTDHDRNISFNDWQAMFATDGAKSEKRPGELLSCFECMAAVHEADHPSQAFGPKTPTAFMPLEKWKDMFANEASKYHWDHCHKDDIIESHPSCQHEEKIVDQTAFS